MRRRHLLTLLAGVALAGGLFAAGFLSRGFWLPWVATADGKAEADDHGPVVEANQVKLTAQARANLRLLVKPLQAGVYWRTVTVPGLIVDRPAQSDRGVVAPVTGVVTRVHHFPGDAVKPGDRLFTLRLLSETLHLTQSELFKSSKEIEITRDQKKLLTDAAASGALAGNKMIELDNQLRRLAVAAQAYRTELQTRGLTPEQIDGVAAGKYVSEIEVNAPRKSGPPDDGEPSFEVQDLKVELGQQVQAGQTMCLLSNHQALYVEGRAFRQETALVETAAKEGWPVGVEFMEDAAGAWPELDQTFTIRHIANTIDTASRTFAFYLPLANQSRSFAKDGRTLTLWRFRPGQKVRLHVRVEKLENVFVLPAEAVVREGPEAYVFRQSGDIFDRKPVRVVYQDRRHVVLANDGSVPPGLYVAQNGAAQINRVLRGGSGGLPPGFHMHADGSIHSNAAHK
jgi:multidrug efflux pump subunit AcrA (membrane-fusion protein)